jgi:MYXO-CTERM domain-containing protein
MVVRRAIAIVGAGIVGVAVCSGAAAEARACTCAGAGSLLAPVGAEHPREASLVFESGCGPSLAPWSVMVDGAPASLREGAVSGEIGTLEIVPMPAIGAEVALFFDCRERGDDPGCGVDDELVERARFTIVATDTIAPPSPLTVTMERVNDEDSCTAFEGQGAVALDLEIGEREPGTWIEFELWRADGNVLAREGRPMPASGDFATVIHAAEEGLNAPEVCVDVTVRDASGNASDGFVEDCLFANSSAPNVFMRGCGCAAGPAPAKESALLALIALMLRRRSSRRPGGRSSSP